MRSGNFLVVLPSGDAFISFLKLEHNMPFGKEEGVKWLKEKHKAHNVTFVSQAQLKSIQEEVDNL